MRRRNLGSLFRKRPPTLTVGLRGTAGGGKESAGGYCKTCARGTVLLLRPLADRRVRRARVERGGESNAGLGLARRGRLPLRWAWVDARREAAA